MRNKVSHQDDLELLSADDLLLHVRGVKNSSFNDLNLFHTLENREQISIDSMHLQPEGILPLERGITLNKFITHEKIQWVFSCLLNNLKPSGKGLSPKLTASEMLALFRYLPLVLGPLIPVGDEHWALFIQLQTLVDIAYAPLLTSCWITLKNVSTIFFIHKTIS